MPILELDALMAQLPKGDRDAVEAAVDQSVHAAERRKYTLDELLAQCDKDAPSPRIPGWDEMTPVGREIL